MTNHPRQNFSDAAAKGRRETRDAASEGNSRRQRLRRGKDSAEEVRVRPSLVKSFLTPSRSGACAKHAPFNAVGGICVAAALLHGSSVEGRRPAPAPLRGGVRKLLTRVVRHDLSSRRRTAATRMPPAAWKGACSAQAQFRDGVRKILTRLGRMHTYSSEFFLRRIFDVANPLLSASRFSRRCSPSRPRSRLRSTTA